MRLTVSQEEILKCNILQYSLTRERRSEERWERRKRRRMAKGGGKQGGGSGEGAVKVGKGETWTFTTAQYWYSDSVFLRSLPLNLLLCVRSPSLAPSHYFSHSLGGSYLTTVICISILLKKISNKVSRAAPSWGRPAVSHPRRSRPSRQYLYFKSYSAKQCLESTLGKFK